MIQIFRAADRGQADYGWLRTSHTFSFGSFQDPKRMGFQALRVMNEDLVVPDEGFGTHPHQDMEIVTYVLEGELEHKDSMGNGAVLRPGEFQRITAGTGITHSEFNPSKTETVHFYQIWLRPEQKGLEPGYEQKRFDETGKSNQLQLVASPSAEESSLKIHQDARIYLAKLDKGQTVQHELLSTRHAWLQVLRGEALLNGQQLSTGDGAAVSEECQLEIQATHDAEVMLFDLQ